MNWNTYFLSIATAVSQRSKDPKTKVGCVIINSDKHIVATGYNGLPAGYPDLPEIWNTDEKHNYVIHAEINALLHSVTSVRGCVLYTTMFPCSDCAKAIASAGISKVFYHDTKYYNIITVKICKGAGIALEQIT